MNKIITSEEAKVLMKKITTLETQSKSLARQVKTLTQVLASTFEANEIDIYGVKYRRDNT